VAVSISLTVKQQDVQSISGNYSLVDAKVTAHYSYGSYNANNPTLTVNVNGNRYTKAVDVNHDRVSSGSEVIFTKADIKIPHNADGTKKISFAASWPTGTSSGTVTDSGSLTLDTIPRATTPAVSGAGSSSSNRCALGAAMTINMPRASSGFTHTLTYSYNGLSGTIGSGLGSSTSWTPPLDAFAAATPNAMTGSGTLTCKTYSGSSLIGTKTCSFYTQIPTTVVPSIGNVAVNDVNGYYSTYDAYVQNKSRISVAITAAGIYGSSISNGSIQLGTSVLSGLSAAFDPTIAGSRTLKSEVTDSRGQKAADTRTVTVLEYITPQISDVNLERCDQDGTANSSGAYAKLSWAHQISSLNSHNTAAMSVRTKTADGTYGDPVTVTASPYIFAANVNTSYVAELTVADNFESSTGEIGVGSTFSLLDFKNDKTGIAFGKSSEKSNTFECALDTEFSGSVTGLLTDETIALFNALTGNSSGGGVTLNSVLQTLLKGVPGVDELWITESTVDAATYWGFGTWEKVEDRMLVGAGGLYTVGGQGGSKDAVLVSHNHSPGNGGSFMGTSSVDAVETQNFAAGSYHRYGYATTNTKGEDGTNKNMPPYRAVNIWRRTA